MMFPLSSEDCELLLAFEKASSLDRLAKSVHRDISAVSRRLQQLSGKMPVIEKIGNRWRLTELGSRVNRWTEEAIVQQSKALLQKTEIKFGASRMFASKVLARNLSEIQSALSEFTVSIVNLDGSLETQLLNGSIDVAFTCGRPQDPAIASKRLVRERYVATASKDFISKHRHKDGSVYDLPFLAFRNTAGLYPFANIVSKAKKITSIFNDPMPLFEAVCAGVGWSILPYFAVKTVPSTLEIFPDIEIQAETYGVWWLNQRKSPLKAVDFAVTWLKKQEL